MNHLIYFLRTNFLLNMDPPRTYLMTPPPKKFVPPVRQVILLQVYGQASILRPKKERERELP